MDRDNPEFDPGSLAAVLYRPEDDVDTLLADFAADLGRSGERLGGLVQRNIKDETGRKLGMQLVDLATGREISICQALGSGTSACMLDPAGLADASHAIARAVAERAALVIVNKFSKQEAAGRGLRSEIAGAVMAGLPVLTAVPERNFDAWKNFTGDRGTLLLCARRAIDGWWSEIAARRHRLESPLSLLRSDAPASPVSHLTH